MYHTLTNFYNNYFNYFNTVCLDKIFHNIYTEKIANFFKWNLFMYEIKNKKLYENFYY